MYFCLVFSSPRSLCFYYLAPVDHGTENLVMQLSDADTHTQVLVLPDPHILVNPEACRPTHTGFHILHTWTHHIHIHGHVWHFWCTLANVERWLGWITTAPNDYFMSGWEEEQRGGQEDRNRIQGWIQQIWRYLLPLFFVLLCLSILICHSQWMETGHWLL